MKKLFEFKIDRDVTETEKETTKNEKGESVTTEKTITKTVSQDVAIKKPTRSLFDDAELFYGVKLSEGIKAGLLTRALLAKRFSNDGGVLSEEEKDRYADLYLKLYEAQLETERASVTPENKRSSEDQEKLDTLLKESAELRRELTDFEMAQSSLFEQTAENRARNKTILWWVLYLSYTDDGNGLQPVFLGDTFEEKLSNYDLIEESEDEFHEALLQKLIYYISFWYVGRVTSQEEFEKLLEDSGDEGYLASKEDLKKEEVKKEEVKKEEVKKEEVKKEEPKEEPKEDPVIEKGTTIEVKELKQEPGDKNQKKTSA